ncbi:MAG: molybdate ABC transporter substrate-binding protein [Acidimicrobiia bacterium]
MAIIRATRRPRSVRAAASVVVVLVALAAAGCSANPSRETVLVSAASSLADAFEELAAAFEQHTPGVEVDLNLGGSSTLRDQIIEGAPVDVFASANIGAMEAVLATLDGASSSRVFALNTLEVAVPRGNPAAVTGLADFADEDLLIGLCLEAVPCGDYARRSLRSAGVVPAVDTEEPDVRSLMLKIELGEIDAGIVYRSDVVAATGAVDSIRIPDEHQVPVTYPIVTVANPPSKLGEAFVAYVLSDEGRAILASYGFGLP